MISKKGALILGAVAIGGLGLASMVAEGDGGGAGAGDGFSPRAGGILGSGGAPNVYNIPGDNFTGFPEPIDYTEFIKNFMAPVTPPPDVPRDRGAAGVSSGGKKTPIYSSEGYMRAGHLDLPSEYAHLPAEDLPGYMEPKQITYGTGYRYTEPEVTTEKYSFWSHLWSSLKGEEEGYTSRYDYVKGKGMVPKVKKVPTSEPVSKAGGETPAKYGYGDYRKAPHQDTTYYADTLASMKRQQREHNVGRGGIRSGGKGESGTAYPGRPYIGKKPED